jgi:hypothetical protein
VEAKELRIHIKVRDSFAASINDQFGAEIAVQEDGYVPDFMAGQHYGDYLILNIDIDTGTVTNWAKPTQQEIESFIKKCNGESEE